MATYTKVTNITENRTVSTGGRLVKAGDFINIDTKKLEASLDFTQNQINKGWIKVENATKYGLKPKTTIANKEKVKDNKTTEVKSSKETIVKEEVKPKTTEVKKPAANTKTTKTNTNTKTK